MIKIINHSYGGRSWGIGTRWLFIWINDYRESVIVKYKFTIDITSKFFRSKTVVLSRKQS